MAVAADLDVDPSLGLTTDEAERRAADTGPNALEALNQKDVPLFSNLLVHYMGGSLDDHLVEGAAAGGRWRTTPLWGLRARSFFLHDGRTTSLTESINLHGGESYQVRKRFFELPAAQRADVIAFMRSL